MFKQNDGEKEENEEEEKKMNVWSTNVLKI